MVVVVGGVKIMHFFHQFGLPRAKFGGGGVKISKKNAIYDEVVALGGATHDRMLPRWIMADLGPPIFLFGVNATCICQIIAEYACPHKLLEKCDF